MFETGEDECVGEEQYEQRGQGKQEKRKRGVQRHDAVTRFVPAARGSKEAQHETQPAEDHHGQQHDAGTRQHERADRRVGNEDDQAHARDDQHDVAERDHALVLGRIGPAAGALHLGVVALVFDAALLCRARRAGCQPVRIDVQRACQFRPQTLERDLAVLMLRTAVGGRGGDDRTEPLEQSSPLTRTERRRVGDVEAHLDLGVRRVGVLAARPTRTGEAPLQLVQADCAGARDPQPRPVHPAEPRGDRP